MPTRPSVLTETHLLSGYALKIPVGFLKVGPTSWGSSLPGGQGAWILSTSTL